jgi:peptidoglycan/LPS O-acetylase OafA/YrhL
MVEGTAVPTRPEASPYSRHLPALDGVRGLAILLVMCSHFFPGTAHNAAERVLRVLLSYGASGVDLFFVLSGFLITGILYDSLGDTHYFRKFYARRALRILPLYYGVLAVYAIVGLVQHRSSHGELLSLALYMQNTSLIAVPIFAYSGPLTLPLGHFWSLAIEEQFYLVWPLLVFLLRTRARLLALCAAFLLLCPIFRFLAWQHGSSLFAVHTNTLYRADALLIGGALALLLRSRLHDRILAAAPWLTLLVFVLPLLWIFPLLSRPFSHPPLAFGELALSYSLVPIGYFGLLGMTFSSTPVRSLFTVKPLRALGKYSYGLYVLHLILLSYFEKPLRDWLRQMDIPNFVAILLVGVSCFIVSFCAAFLSYQLYERHFLRLKRFFDYRPHGSAASTASAATSPALH